MTTTQGTFAIELVPAQGLLPGTGRFDFTKGWSGGLAGESVGTMLSGGDPSAGLAGYVALETFTGSVDGREGSFVLQQFGTMDAAGTGLAYLVTPGSGTGELEGLAGTLRLDVVDDVHQVEFTYELL